MLYGTACAKYPGDNLSPVYIGRFSTGNCFSAKKVTAQIFLRLYIHEFFRIFKTCNIDNRQYELYISMKAVMQIFMVRETQLFKVK